MLLARVIKIFAVRGQLGARWPVNSSGQVRDGHLARSWLSPAEIMTRTCFNCRIRMCWSFSRADTSHTSRNAPLDASQKADHATLVCVPTDIYLLAPPLSSRWHNACFSLSNPSQHPFFFLSSGWPLLNSSSSSSSILPERNKGLLAIKLIVEGLTALTALGQKDDLDLWPGRSSSRLALPGVSLASRMTT